MRRLLLVALVACTPTAPSERVEPVVPVERAEARPPAPMCPLSERPAVVKLAWTEGHGRWTDDALLAPGGMFVATRAAAEVRIWDVGARRLRHVLPMASAVTAVAWRSGAELVILTRSGAQTAPPPSCGASYCESVLQRNTCPPAPS